MASAFVLTSLLKYILTSHQLQSQNRLRLLRLVPLHASVKSFVYHIPDQLLFDTRAAIGTAETPAEPINGLIFSLLNLFINFAINTPLAVPIPKAITPKN